MRWSWRIFSKSYDYSRPDELYLPAVTALTTDANPLPLDQILQGDCVDILSRLPERSIDLIFADPPYNLQLQKDLYRPNLSLVDGVDDKWDRFEGFEDYDTFSIRWLKACRRVLKESGTIWVIGTYHNIFRLGTALQDLGFWILNDVLWIKTNPMPNFRGVRFTNAHETLIWASKSKGSRYIFNYQAMKSLNDDLQMRSDWLLPICSGAERIKVDGKKAHSTQKPEALLYRVILAASRPGDVVLDPFFGTGTTGVAAKKLHRRWIGIELEPTYIQIAEKRLAETPSQPYLADILDYHRQKRGQPRFRFGCLLENGLLQPGQALFFQAERTKQARIRSDGRLVLNDFVGSIHQTATHLSTGSPLNGWKHWYFQSDDGRLHPIDELRQKLENEKAIPADSE